MPASESSECYFHPVRQGDRMPSGLRVGEIGHKGAADDEVSSPLKEHRAKRTEERFLRQKKAAQPVVSIRDCCSNRIEIRKNARSTASASGRPLRRREGTTA